MADSVTQQQYSDDSEDLTMVERWTIQDRIENEIAATQGVEAITKTSFLTDTTNTNTSTTQP